MRRGDHGHHRDSAGHEREVALCPTCGEDAAVRNSMLGHGSMRVVPQFLPLFNGDAVEPAEQGKESDQRDKQDPLTLYPGPCGHGDCRSEDDGDGDLLGEPMLDPRWGVRRPDMDEAEVNEGSSEKYDVFPPRGRVHARKDEPEEGEAGQSSNGKRSGAVPGVEEMTFAQLCRMRRREERRGCGQRHRSATFPARAAVERSRGGGCAWRGRSSTTRERLRSAHRARAGATSEREQESGRCAGQRWQEEWGQGPRLLFYERGRNILWEWCRMRG